MVAVPSIPENKPAGWLSQPADEHPHLHDITDQARAQDAFAGHERIVLARDRPARLEAIVAVHDTTLGPALGGCRMRRYSSCAEALADALRLSRVMTYKAALAGLDLGGGKAVIIADPRTDKSPSLLSGFARVLNRLGGRFVTGQDAGITVDDIDRLAELSPHVVGSRLRGAGDPSPDTAIGVHAGLRAAVRHRFGSDSLSGLTVAVQGVGNVGEPLCALLAADGVRLVVADVDGKRVARAVERFGARAVAPDAIHCAEADIFAPCALGGVLGEATIGELRAAIVAGSANNPLASEALSEELRRRAILYAPDYVINAGGLLHVAAEYAGRGSEETHPRILAIGETLTAIFHRADAEGLPTNLVAERLAHERLHRHGRPDLRRRA